MPHRREQRDAEREQPGHTDCRQRRGEPRPEVTLEVQRTAQTHEVVGELLHAAPRGEGRVDLVPPDDHSRRSVPGREGGTGERGSPGAGPGRPPDRLAIEAPALHEQRDDRHRDRELLDIETPEQVRDEDHTQERQREPPRQRPAPRQPAGDQQERQAGERRQRVRGAMDVRCQRREIALQLGETPLVGRRERAHDRHDAADRDDDPQQARLAAIAPRPRSRRRGGSGGQDEPRTGRSVVTSEVPPFQRGADGEAEQVLDVDHAVARPALRDDAVQEEPDRSRDRAHAHDTRRERTPLPHEQEEQRAGDPDQPRRRAVVGLDPESMPPAGAEDIARGDHRERSRCRDDVGSREDHERPTRAGDDQIRSHAGDEEGDGDTHQDDVSDQERGQRERPHRPVREPGR